jgi:hypothetical protein
MRSTLSNLTFTAGLTYTFPLDTTLSPGGRLTIGTNDFTGSLDNGGEKITLTDASGTVIESFAFDDVPPWPQASDGEGFSLVRISPSSQLDPNLPSSWRTSTTAGGNPGGSDATTFQGGDLIAYALQGKELTPTLTGIQVPKNLAADDLIQKFKSPPISKTGTPFPILSKNHCLKMALSSKLTKSDRSPKQDSTVSR